MHIPRKRFGQHFLRDRHAIDKMVSAILPQAGEKMVEIGPGLGVLTRELLVRLGELTVIELDRDLIPELQKLQSFGKINIYQSDALRFDFNTLKEKRMRIVGNLPYNISTPLLFHLLDYQKIIVDMHFLLQKEVAERITAEPGSSDYGPLSIMVQYHCTTEMLFSVGPNAFYPPPKVDSAFIRLTPCQPRLIALNLNDLRGVVRQAFSQRRKMLHNSLKNQISSEALLSLGIDPQIRAEKLTVDDFVRISNIITNIRHTAI